MAVDNRVKLIQQADKLFKQGKTDAALKEYQKILDLKSDDVEIRKIIGDLKLKLNKTDEAVHQFEWIADYYLKEGFYPKATAMFKRITRLDPTNETISFKLADLYAKQGLVIESKQIYLELVDEYKRQNNHKKALGIYKKILEFDRGNTKMHLLLAENYLRENMVEEAVNEYLFTTDILTKRKEFKQAQEILSELFRRIKSIKVLERLVQTYLSEGDETQAVQVLSGLGDEIFKHPSLLKILGELYLKKNQIDRAERIYKKLIEYDTSQTEMIMNLGKVYIQREEYDKVYQLFLPLVERFASEKKYDEAASLLRFIITSNNTYLPALLKLAAIFKMTGKTTSLIAIYEALIPIYEKKQMTSELKEVLGELIKISDTPFNYQEMLQRLTEERKPAPDDSQRERDFISFQLNNVNQAIRENNFKKASEILLMAKDAFPKNVDIRVKLFDLLQLTGNVDGLVSEGIELLELHREQNNDGAYNNLYEKLSRLRPNDERLLFLSGNEKTNIEIDFDHHELIEQMSELHDAGVPEIVRKEEPEAEEVFLLEGEDSVTFKKSQSEKEFTKGLSSHLVELDFYISEGYFDNAEKILHRLREDYPESREVINRLERLQKIREQRVEKPPPAEEPLQLDVDHLDLDIEVPIQSDVREESGFLQQFEDSRAAGVAPDLRLDEAEAVEPLFEDQPTGTQRQPEIRPDRSADRPAARPEAKAAPRPAIDEFESIFNEEPAGQKRRPQAPEARPAAVEEGEGDIFMPLVEESPPAAAAEADEFQFDLEMDRVEEEPAEILPLAEEEEQQIIRSPEPKPKPKPEPPPRRVEAPKREDETRSKKVEKSASASSSGVDLLNLDNILLEDRSGKKQPVESPFRDIEDLVLESEDELLAEDNVFLAEENYYETERLVKEELATIAHWTKELEKQRTSTMEKNMMEIFKEFKRGVDEKIGSEDFETRYNLGIAYKEMGLLEEAINEFLISAKHPVKFFDSAGMLGICFREKGMLDESIGLFERALKSPERSADEIKAVKFELFMTARQKDDFPYARKLAEEIMRLDADYRNIRELVSELKNK